MIPDKAPGEDVFHASGDLKKEAHVATFEKYKDMYVNSIENPDGRFLFSSIRGKNFHSVPRLS